MEYEAMVVANKLLKTLKGVGVDTAGMALAIVALAVRAEQERERKGQPAEPAVAGV